MIYDFLQHIVQKINPVHIFFSFFNIAYFLIASVIIFYVSAKHRNALSPGNSLFEFVAPKRQWFTTSALTDLCMFVLMKAGAFGLILVANVAIGFIVSKGIRSALELGFGEHIQVAPSAPMLLLVGALAFLALDFMNFYIHYLQHKIPILWEFHKVHHSASSLNPLTAHRFHPVQNQIDALAEGSGLGVVYGIFGYFFKFEVQDIALLLLNYGFVVRMLILEPLQHSHLPISFGHLDRFIYSPHMHQVHHSSIKAHWDKNFGSTTTLWDRLFKCYYLPVDGERIEYGLDKNEHQDYGSILHCYIVPFQKCYRIILKKKPLLLPEKVSNAT